jgi:hypothetical protein
LLLDRFMGHPPLKQHQLLRINSAFVAAIYLQHEDCLLPDSRTLPLHMHRKLFFIPRQF